MPNWRKVATSGSAANFSSLSVDTSITASIVSSSQFIGNLSGTASFATNVVSSSYAGTASVLLGSVVSASYAATASYVVNALTASYVITAQTASYVLNAVSSSFASTASLAPNYTTLTSFNSFTSSYRSGSFTGSFTGSLFGTASWANNVISASYAATASIATSSSYALSASFAPAGNPFPFSGSALITGSLGVTGSVSLRSGSNLTVNNGLISASYGTNNLSVGGTPGWTSALRNTAFGLSTQGSVTTQTGNTSVGFSTLLGGDQNTAVGAYAASLNTGTGNVIMGYEALSQQTSNISYNVAVGYQSMYNASGSGNLYNIGIGYLTLNNTRGANNIAIGQRAGILNTTGANNVFLGYYAGAYNTTGAQNIAIGYQAGFHLSESSENILMGNGAGGNNPGVGITMGNAKAIDILAEKDNLQFIIQVKAIYKKKNVGWPMMIDKVHTDHFYVFVNLNGDKMAEPEYYICTGKEAKNRVKQYETRGILSLSTVNGDEFKGRWDKIK